VSVPILRNSERRSFKRCQAQWWWAYREGLKPRGAESTPLWFGTGVHLGLAEWYIPGLKRGRHPAETFEEFAGEALHSIKVKDKDATEDRVAEYEDGKTLGIQILEEYVRHYGTDDHMDIIQAEQTFGIDIPWPGADRQSVYETEPGELLIKLHGTYDGVYRDLEDGKIKLLETKTAKAISTGHLSLDDQAGTYWAVATMTLRKQGLISEKERISGIVYNFLRKALPDDRPRDADGYACNKPTKANYIEVLTGVDSWTEAELKKEKLDSLESIAAAHHFVVLGERSKVQPQATLQRHTVWRTSAERNSQLRRIQDEAVQMQLVRDGSVAPTKNPTRDCMWDCSFFSLCELQERGGEWKDYRRIAYRVEDPYRDHRKSADE
jgi:hypothetical protein